MSAKIGRAEARGASALEGYLRKAMGMELPEREKDKFNPAIGRCTLHSQQRRCELERTKKLSGDQGRLDEKNQT
jgi:hypothetical protein